VTHERKLRGHAILAGLAFLLSLLPAGVAGAAFGTRVAAMSPIDASASAFAGGNAVVAQVVAGKVALAVEGEPSIGSSGGLIGVIDLKEAVAGALRDSGGTEALRLRLPCGFKWRTPDAGAITTVWGDPSLAKNIALSIDEDGRSLLISNNVPCASSTFVKLSLAVDVEETVARDGEVKVTVSGATAATPSELVVANYGKCGVTVKACSTADIVAGKVAQNIGKLEIDEVIPGSLIPGRTITLALPPDVVCWSRAPKIDTDLSKNYGDFSISARLVESDDLSGMTVRLLCEITFISPSGRGTRGQAEPAKLVLEDMQVTPACDFSGDLKVEVGGSQGVSGTVVLAKVRAPVTVAASSTPQVIGGVPDQPVGDITITENFAGAILDVAKGYRCDDEGYVSSATLGDRTCLTIAAPPDVTFTRAPRVEVVEGDLEVDASVSVENIVVRSWRSADNVWDLEGVILIPVKRSSTKPSTIKISGIKVTPNRAVAGGDLTFSVKGFAVDETLCGVWDEYGPEYRGLFFGHDTPAEVVVGKCVAPAPGGPEVVMSLTVGSTVMKVNGQEVQMDAAPYIKDDRIMVPVKWVAKAFGIPEENVTWDSVNRTVTVKTAGQVMELRIGENVMTINDAIVRMDAAAEIVPPGRTCVPMRFLAQAFGAKVTWDDATQTATFER